MNKVKADKLGSLLLVYKMDMTVLNKIFNKTVTKH